MKIVYRVSPFKPDNPAVVFPKDKWKLVEFSHTSFINARGDMYETTYILDSCPDWGNFFRRYGKVLEVSHHNKNTSLLKAYDIAFGLDDDVLFVEDDYLWRPSTIPKLEVAIKKLSVVSPYDHPAHYIEDRFSDMFELRLIGDTVYRTCPSNTHTFGVSKDVLKNNIDMMKKFGVNDHGMFTELNKTHQLWCPTHSFATHLASNCIAPNVDWKLPLP